MARLKVFTWADGFHAYTVATTSRAGALAAWGVARDLFKDGEAKEITEGPDHDAALATPGETIRRVLSVDVGKVAPAARAREPSKASLERVAHLERELAELQAGHAKAVAELEDRRRSLEDEAADLDRNFKETSTALEKRLATARRKLQT